MKIYNSFIILFFYLIFFIPPIDSNAQTVVSSGLIARYCFDGDAKDAVGTKHGTVNGAALTTDRLGRANRAYYFDGVNDYIQLPSDVWMNGDFTVTGWLFVQSYKNFSRFFEFGNGPVSDNVVYSPTPAAFSGDAFVIRKNSCVTSGMEESAYCSPFTLSKWVHVAIVLKGTKGEIWRDGVNTTITSSSVLGPPCNVLRTQNYFGRSSWTSDRYFDGKMDDVRVYNRALSALEIDTLFKLNETCIACDMFEAGFKELRTSCLDFQFADTTILSSKGIKNWNWDFGDATTSTLKNPSHSYASAGTYTVRLIVTDSMGCIDTAEHVLTIAPSSFANAGTDESLCLNGFGEATTTLNGSGGISYSWSPTTGLSNPLIPNPIATITSSTTYILTVTDALGCIDKDTVVLTTSKFATITAMPDSIIACLDAQVQLNATGGETYLWSPPTGLSNPNIANPKLLVNGAGFVVVTATDKNGCIGSDTVFIKIIDGPTIKATPKDTTLCFGTKVQLNATGAKTYYWEPAVSIDKINIPNPIALIEGSLKYIVKGTDSNGCIGYDTLNIRMFDLKPIKASSSDNRVSCLNSQTTLSAIGAKTYSWTPAIFCDNPNSSSTAVHPPHSIVFTVFGVDENGCTNSDIISVLFEGESKIHIPNAFTPDNDNLNDKIKIIDQCNFDFLQMQIYNRWGLNVFTSTDINGFWDGSFDGKPCSTGVYYYFVKGKNKDGKDVIFKGDISLIR